MEQQQPPATPSLSDILRTWRQNWAIAKDCLEQLRPLMQSNTPSPGITLSQRKTANLLFKTAPSAALHSQVNALQDSACTPVDLSDMQSEYMVLQEAVYQLDNVLGQARALQSAWQQELQTEERTQAPADQSTAIQEQQERDIDISLVGAEELQGPTGSQGPGGSDGDGSPSTQRADSPAQQISTAEKLVLFDNWIQGCTRHLEMLVTISASINLVTPAEVLDTYIYMMELEPYADERVCATLQGLCDSEKES